MKITQFGQKYTINITEPQTFWTQFVHLCENLKNGQNPTFGFFIYDDFNIFKELHNQDFNKHINNSKNVDDFHLFMMYARERDNEIIDEVEVYKGALHFNVQPKVVLNILYEILNVLKIRTSNKNLLPLLIIFEIESGQVVKQKHVFYDSSVNASIIKNDFLSIFEDKTLINWNKVVELSLETMKFINEVTKVIGNCTGS